MTERLGAVKDLTLHYLFKDNSWWYVEELKNQVKDKNIEGVRWWRPNKIGW